MRRTALLAVAGLLALLPSTGAAREGVVEINQACASGTGCFPGDTAGFPVQITGAAGRNYRLTGDLTVTSANTTAIEMSGSTQGFVIDLGGFSLRGPVTCSGAPLACSTSGTGVGVNRALGSTAAGITVRNGTISGFGSTGVSLLLADECVLENLVVRENAATGVRVGASSRVSGVAAISNLGTGIVTGSGSLIESCTARENSSLGIGGGDGGVIVESAALSNGANGIDPQASGVVIARSQARLNGTDGLRGGFATVFIENSSSSNGQVAAANGIFAGSGSRIQSNVMRENVGAGLNFVGDCAYSNNTITDNTVDAVVPATGVRGGNFCSGAGAGVATCP